MENQILFPIRCYSCNYVLGRKQLPYERLIELGYTPEQAMNALGIKRYCCRTYVMCPIQIPMGPSETPPGLLIESVALPSLMEQMSLSSRQVSAESALEALRNETAMDIDGVRLPTTQSARVYRADESGRMVLSQPPSTLPTIQQQSQLQQAPTAQLPTIQMQVQPFQQPQPQQQIQPTFQLPVSKINSLPGFTSQF